MSLVKIHLTISKLKKGTKAFHNLDVPTWKDLLSSMTLALNVGDTRKIPPDNLKLYAPCDFKENSVWLCLNANNKISK